MVSVPTIDVPLRLPPVMLPVTFNDPSVPTDVILVCAAVVSVPTIDVPLRLPPVMLPVTLTVVPVCVVALTLAPPNMLPPVMLPVALTCPPVVKLPPATLAVTVNDPNVPTDVICV